MHMHLIASIRWANIYRSTGNKKALARGGLHTQFVENFLQSAEYRITGRGGICEVAILSSRRCLDIRNTASSKIPP
jgi:hypothetical protein